MANYPLQNLPRCQGARRATARDPRPFSYLAVLFLAAALTLSFVTQGSAQSPVDSWWAGLAPAPAGQGTNEVVESFAVYGGDLVVAGRFTRAGGGSFPGIARWTGSGWAQLGPGIDGYVYGLLTWQNNGHEYLIATGDFTRSGTTTVNRIAAWDGHSWLPLGSGLNSGWGLCLAVYQGRLVVGGRFSTAGGAVAHNIAQWNGASWSAIGPPTAFNQDVVAMTAEGGKLYAGGWFTAPGTHLSSFDGSSWQNMGGGTNGVVLSLTSFQGGIVAGGVFDSPASNIASWDGSHWHALGGGCNSNVWGLTTHQGKLLAGGSFSSPAERVAAWNGTTWTSLSSGIQGTTVLGLRSFQGDLWVGGQFSGAGGNASANIARWGLFDGGQQPNWVTGRVVDAFILDERSSGIALASVQLFKDGLLVAQGTTDPDGNYKLSLESDSHTPFTIVVRAQGYFESGRLIRFYASRADQPVKLKTATVVLLHGALKDASFWETDGLSYVDELREDGFVPHAFSLVPSPLDWIGPRGGVDAQAERLSAELTSVLNNVHSFQVVAHSMGGLVARRYMLSNPDKVVRLICLGTPNHGSELARSVTFFPALIALLCRTSSLYLGPLCNQILNVTRAQALLDLDAESDMLDFLNYGGGRRAESNFPCKIHPEETQLDSRAHYVTYGGTDSGVNVTCAMWPIEVLLEPHVPSFLCKNDDIVPISSVPLRDHYHRADIQNYRDLDCGLRNGHRSATCQDIVKDPEVLAGVIRALRDGQFCPSAGQGVEEDPRNAGALWRGIADTSAVLANGAVSSFGATIDACDLARFELRTDGGNAAIELVTPDGEVVTKDNYASFAGATYEEQERQRVFQVAAPELGPWRIRLIGASSDDEVFCSASAALQGGANMAIIDLTPEVDLNAGEHLRVAMEIDAATPPQELNVEGSLRGDLGPLGSFSLNDAGVGGDSASSDGVYSAEVDLGALGVSPSEAMELACRVTGVTSDGGPIDRSVRTMLFTQSRPDLHIADESLSLIPSDVNEEDQVVARLLVKNVGTAAASTATVRFYDGLGGPQFAVREIHNLASGASAVVEASWPVRRAQKHYQIFCDVAVSDGTSESNGNDDRAQGTVTILGVEDPPPMCSVGESVVLPTQWNLAWRDEDGGTIRFYVSAADEFDLHDFASPPLLNGTVAPDGDPIYLNEFDGLPGEVMVLRFNRGAAVGSLGPVQDGQRFVTLEGSLLDGRCVNARAVIEIVGAQFTSDLPSGSPTRDALTLSAPTVWRLGELQIIKLASRQRQKVEVAIFDLSGRRVLSLCDREIDAGESEVSVSQKQQSRMAPGVYFLQARAGAFRASRRVLILR